ncbi:MAG TPA: electron transfer flavoprotein subunit alpha/FixB family protein [Candidatus Limnocylindrales bacterium]|jgi:electron transfer flavoprotein alpha subunit|nr:electron transfer flavoprotein subunit alpha/FixB family protein [Candidatus Limnocylindrales bacterium]
MAAFWAIGEIADGAPTRLTLELATLARQLAEAAGGEARTVLIGTGAAAAAGEAARYGPNVLAVEATGDAAPVAQVVAPRLASLVERDSPEYLLIGASADGKDICGLLLGLTDMPMLANGAGVEWADGPQVEMSTFGGKLVTKSAFTGSRGMILVRPGSVTAEEAAQPGGVETAAVDGVTELAAVRVVDRIEEAGAAAPIEEARIIVGGGRGVGNAEGFALVQELADALGGAVGATRAVVDAGWIGYGQQIGQTGKIVKPSLYVACGISGAIQHKVGVQTAGTIVAINKDPDAPIAEFADLMVVGDLFEILPRLTEAIRVKKSGGG